jgi:hypothetical protein
MANHNRDLIWISLGAATCLASGVLFSGGSRRQSKAHSLTTASSIRLEDINVGSSDEDEIKDGETIACLRSGVLFSSESKRFSNAHSRTSSSRLEDIKEDTCGDDEIEDGETIIRRLRKSDWQREIIEFVNGLTFNNVSDIQFKTLAGELLVALEKDILSIKTLCDRFRGTREVVQLFAWFSKVYTAALQLLKSVISDVLKIELDKVEVSAEAQSYSHCFSFLASHGSCADIISAIAVNFPVRHIAWRKLGNGLQKSKKWSKQDIAFIDKLAQPLPSFDEHVVEALNIALQQDTVSG